MNKNTKYNDLEVYENDENGNPTVYSEAMRDFSFDAYKVGVGMVYKKFDFILGMYISEKEHNFSQYGTSAIGIPFLKIDYNFYKF